MTAAEVGPASVSVMEAISAAMGEIRAVGKDSTNTTPGSNYKFRGIDAVMNAAGPAFRRHGVVVTPRKVRSIEHTTVVVGQKRTEMASVRVVVCYRWYGPMGDHIDTEVPGEAFDSGDKATAKAMSVAYRTLLLQALTLPTDDPDPDASSYARSAPVDEQAKAADLGKWAGEVKAAGLDVAKLKALWTRMVAEWETIAWSDERRAIIQPSVDQAQAKATQHPEDPEPPPADDGDQAEANFLMDLAQAEDARDTAAARALVKVAIELRRSDLRQKAADLANRLTAGKAGR